MARGILWIALMVCALLLAGCSVAIIHPPSAATFMEKNEDDFVMGASASFFFSEILLMMKWVLIMLQTASRK